MANVEQRCEARHSSFLPFNNLKRSALSGDYDKILRENIATVFLPLAEKYLGIRIVRSEELKDKLQTTIEKETDFIRIVETETGDKFILHLEFQSVDEEGMIYRMQEYYGLLRRKYQLPVKQFVIYLGQKASKMQSRLAPEEVFTGFTLQSLRDYDYQSLLASDVPEEIILTILSDFGEKRPDEVLKDILGKLKSISREEITLRKYIRQLSVLARLRNLTKETQKQVTDMGLLYDITKDYLYQEGLTKGREEGIERGIEKGIEKGIEQGSERARREMIIEMLRDGALTHHKIAALAKVPVAYVTQVAHELSTDH
jgi:predicted transposase YdaD